MRDLFTFPMSLWAPPSLKPEKVGVQKLFDVIFLSILLKKWDYIVVFLAYSVWNCLWEQCYHPASGLTPTVGSVPCTVSHVTIWSYLHWRLGSDAACICICLTVIVWYDSRWKGLHVYCQWHKRGSGLLSPWRQWLHQRLHNLSHHWRSSSDPAQVPHQDPPQGWHASFSYHQHAAGGPWGPHSSAERLHPSGLWHGLQWWLHPL